MERLNKRFAILLSDGNGSALGDNVATWEIINGEGTLTRESTITENYGVAENYLTLGQQLGEVQVKVTAVGSGEYVIFTAKAIEPVIEIHSGDQQTVDLSNSSQIQLAVYVTDQDGMPAEGLYVLFVIKQGDGGFEAARPVINADGIATTDLNIYKAGDIFVEATVVYTEKSVTFTITAIN